MRRSTPPVLWHVGGPDVHMRIPLLKALEQRGFAVAAVGSEDDKKFKAHDIPYFRYALDRWINPASDLRSLKQLERLFQTHKPDIVHGFDTKPGILAPIAAYKANVPARVRTITGMGYLFSSRSLVSLILKPVYAFLQKKAGKNNAFTIFQNSDDRRFFLDNKLVPSGCDFLVRGSGIPIDQFQQQRPSAKEARELRQQLGLRDDQKVVILVSRLVKLKGISEYLQAARQTRQAFENAVFLLAGPLASEKRQAVSLQEISAFENDVKYLGPRTDVPALLAISDLFVLPSYYREGVPRVLLEAASAGLPIITTDMPGCKDVVRANWNGWIVPPRDVAALTSALISALQTDESTRRIMGERGRAYVEKEFSLDGVADAYAAVYRCALEQAVRPEKLRGA